MAGIASPGNGPTDPNDTPPPSSGVGAEALDAVSAPGARARGDAQDANDAIQENDPTAPQTVSPDEQAQYDQFTSRFRLMISDMANPAPSDDGKPSKSLGQTVLDQLNNPKVPLSHAIGQVTAQLAMIIVNTAKAQKVTYDPDVLFHASVECVMMVYLIGSARGIFKGVPPFHGLNKDGTYDFDDQELHIVAEAQMQAARFFGNMEMKAGGFSQEVREANLDFWKKQVKREVDTGIVDQSVIQKIQDALHNTGQQTAQPSQPSDQSQQPSDQPDQSQASAPPEMAGISGSGDQPPTAGGNV